MNPRMRLAVVALSAAGCASAPVPQTARAPAVAVEQHPVVVASREDVVARMIAEGTQHSHVDADLSYLLDVIGPRLSGSPEMRRANEWTQRKFREYGADRAELEGWTFGVGWTRGPMTLRMLAPQRREMLGVSWGWAPGTNGPVAGDVVYLDARTREEFDRRFAGKLRGKWIMLGPPSIVPNPDAAPMQHADSLRLDSLQRALQPHTDDERHFQQVRAAVLVREGIAGAIVDGGKEFGLFTMSGSPRAILPYPMIVVSNDDYAQLERLARRGEPTRIEADIRNSFTQDALQQYNTVAEIRGAERPDEVVLVGAHLDSWDLATGGTDNGTGAIGVLEAARILAAMHLRPKRSIRFVLFAGEEEGLFGSQAYVATHAKELDKFQAVLVLDNGTGRISGMALQGREDLRDMWTALLEPFTAPGGAPLVVRSGNKTGTDHLSFLPYGVPSFNYDQLTRGYNHTHHSQVDDYNHTVPEDVAQAATIMAVNAWQLAELNELLPRGPKQR